MAPVSVPEGFPRRFAGQVGLVTGAGGAIGRESALRLAREGASVAVADVRLGAAQETVAQLEAEGSDGLALECDVRDEGSGRRPATVDAAGDVTPEREAGGQPLVAGEQAGPAEVPVGRGRRLGGRVRCGAVGFEPGRDQ